MPFSGKQRVAAYLAEKAKEQGQAPIQRKHVKSQSSDMGTQLVNMAKGSKYPQVGVPSKGNLLKGSSNSDFSAMPKFQKIKSLIKF